MEDAKNPIYEPRKFYEQTLKAECHKQAEAYFDALKERSGVDEAANAAHVEAYHKAQSNLESMNKKASSEKGLRGFFIALVVFSFFFGVLSFLFYSVGWWMVLIGVLLIAGGITLLVYVCSGMRRTIEYMEDAAKSLQREADICLVRCFQDMEPLNRLYDWNAPCEILRKASPILSLDPHFSAERFAYLVQKFGMPESLGNTTSVLGVVSGHIQGNPFVLEKDISESIINKLYTGTLTIHWTTTYHDKNGTHVEHHSETLMASVRHEAPAYEYSTRLIYGNEAAPHLNFSRSPSGQNGEDEKSLSRFVKKRSKELTKKEKNDLMDDDPKTNFTRMGNDKFDALFGADDRDNEVEFRLLYTPLAQKNILDLLTNPEPFGDDFVQVKEGMLNSIASRHSQSFDYSANPASFRNFDLKDAKENFVSYCDDFIRNLYFDLCPIISVPLYQLHKPSEFIYGDWPYSLSNYEHEVMANGLDPASFRPEEADPSLPLILKVVRGKKEGGGDDVRVHCFSFKTTPRTDYVSTYGGDGRWHEVPVHWIQYDLVERERGMEVTSVGASQESYSQRVKKALSSLLGVVEGHYERGLYCHAYDLEGGSPNLNEKIRAAFQDDNVAK